MVYNGVKLRESQIITARDKLNASRLKVYNQFRYHFRHLLILNVISIISIYNYPFYPFYRVCALQRRHLKFQDRTLVIK